MDRYIYDTDTNMLKRRWVIQREEGTTYCDEPHPVRLGCNPEHHHGEPWARRWAIDTGAKGYLCSGGEQHGYPVWIVYNANDDREDNAGIFDTYKEAVALRNKLNEAEKGNHEGREKAPATRDGGSVGG